MHACMRCISSCMHTNKKLAHRLRQHGLHIRPPRPLPLLLLLLLLLLGWG